MTTNGDPPRLTEPAAGASSDVLTLLASTAADAPTTDELSDLDRRVSAQVTMASAPPSVGPMVVGALGAVVMAGAVLGWLLLSQALPPAMREPPAPPVQVVVPTPPVSAKPEHPPPPVAPAIPAEKPRPPPTAEHATVRLPPLTPPPTPASEDELSLLEHAQAALGAGDSALALALAERHARLFPDGVLVQERELLAIEALFRAGRRVDAQERASDFRQRFPGSAHLPRLKQLAVDAGGS